MTLIQKMERVKSSSDNYYSFLFDFYSNSSRNLAITQYFLQSQQQFDNDISLSLRQVMIRPVFYQFSKYIQKDVSLQPVFMVPNNIKTFQTFKLGYVNEYSLALQQNFIQVQDSQGQYSKQGIRITDNFHQETHGMHQETTLLSIKIKLDQFAPFEHQKQIKSDRLVQNLG